MKRAGAAVLLLLIAAAAVSVRGATQPTRPAIEAARRGGVTIVCRHGITDAFSENEATLRYDDPSTQRRLAPAGERQADSLGRAVRALGIAVTEVVASPMDRARRTAELAFGRARLDSAWHTRGEDFSGWKMAARVRTLGAPVARGNRVVVSHIGTIYSALPSIRGELDEGDCAVVRPRGGAGFDVVGVVPWRAWLEAARR